MVDSTDQLLTWLKDFTTKWLPENISNDTVLLNTIQNKLFEFEQLIIRNNEIEENYYRSKLLNNESSSSEESDNEQVFVASTSIEQSPANRLSSTISSTDQYHLNDNEEEQSRRALLQISDNSDDSLSNDDTIVGRPSIRLKRISTIDAERYKPLAWKNVNSDGISDNQQNVFSDQSEIRNSTDNENVPENDIDNRVNSKELKSSDSDDISTTSSTSDDEEFVIKFRKPKLVNNQNKSQKKLRTQHSKSPKKKNTVTINFDPSKVASRSSSESSISKQDKNDESVKNISKSKPNKVQSVTNINVEPQNDPITTNVDDEMNEISANDHIHFSSSDESSTEKTPIDVPSYSHLLNHSKLSTDSDSQNLDVTPIKKRSNQSKRLLESSPKSDESPIVIKRSKIANKRPVNLLSLSSNDDDTNSTNDENYSNSIKKSSPSLSSRIRIERSSSSNNSNDSDTSAMDDENSKNKRITRSNSTANKRKTLRRKISSTNSTSNDEKSDRKMKKSKNQDTNSDDQDTNDEGLSPSKRKLGRKNIRKILDDKELNVLTKDAIEDECERRRRIAEKQKDYNDTLLEQSFCMSNSESQNSSGTNSRLILEFDKTTNESLIEVAPELVQQLKRHQYDGVKFLWNNIFESIDAIRQKKQRNSGCILAHCMGLGKTLQVISFIHTVLKHEEITNVKTCLILCPINVALNWSVEFDNWLKDVEPSIDCYQLTTVKANLRMTHLNFWYENGGVAILGYETYRRLVNGIGIKNKKLKDLATKCLVDPGPDIIVADEGHILKNSQTSLAKCLSKIKTPRRIVLTGTPLQNNLIEYYCMVSFIKPNLLGSQSEYINRFVNPIQNGQHRDSNEEDVRLMKRRACVLHELLTGFIDRKDYSLLKEYLPPKFEYTINIRLSDLQSHLYDIYLKQQVNQEQRLSVLKKDFKSAQLFADYQYLQKIWTHPFLLYPHFIDRWKKKFNRDDENLIDDNDLDLMFIDDDDDDENVNRKKKKKSKTKQIENKTEFESSYSGFLIENIKDEIEEVTPNVSEFKKRRQSNSSTTTTLTSNTTDNNVDTIDETDSDMRSIQTNNIRDKDDDEDDDIEIIKTYPTRNRVSMTNKQNNKSSTKKINENNENSNDETNPDDNYSQPWLDSMREQFWFPFLDMLPEESKYDVELSGKCSILKFILEKCNEIGDKILLFSRSLYTLNHIEKFLHYLQIESAKEYEKRCDLRRQLREMISTDRDNENINNEYIDEPVQWIRDQDYFRMDGQTDITTRKRYAKAFNDLSNTRARLFLISTLAGGIGINLVGSNRVIIFDASWNPSHDTQAIFRSYRFGQKKPVYIYRFLAHGTMEEKIYQRQIVKQSISQRVVDDHQLDRHFTQNDIKELYKFQRELLPQSKPVETLFSESNTSFDYPIPKDHLLFDLLCEHNRWIHSYHSHDSLLENKVDEGLTADERRRAIEEYENLKRLPDPRQLAIQRLQEQQRLNALIAQQNLSATQGIRMQQALLEQMNPESARLFQFQNGQQSNANKALQYLYALERNQMAINRRQQNLNTNQRTTTDHVPILPRVPTNNLSNEVIVVGSDDDMDDANRNTMPN